MKKDNSKPAYYITLIKIEGHEKWRVLVHQDRGGFAREWAIGDKKPNIELKKVYLVDRQTGEISETIA